MLLSVLIAASNQDKKEKAELTKRLMPLIRKRNWELYAELMAGDDINAKTMQQVAQSDLVLLILSADFLAEELCHQVATSALARNKCDLNTTVVVLLRHCDWTNTHFKDCIVLPFDHETIAENQNGDDAWYHKVVKGIEPLMENAELKQTNTSLQQKVLLLEQQLERLTKRKSNE